MFREGLVLTSIVGAVCAFIGLATDWQMGLGIFLLASAMLVGVFWSCSCRNDLVGLCVLVWVVALVLGALAYVDKVVTSGS